MRIRMAILSYVEYNEDGSPLETESYEQFAARLGYLLRNASTNVYDQVVVSKLPDALLQQIVDIIDTRKELAPRVEPHPRSATAAARIAQQDSVHR